MVKIQANREANMMLHAAHLDVRRTVWRQRKLVIVGQIGLKPQKSQSFPHKRLQQAGQLADDGHGQLLHSLAYEPGLVPLLDILPRHESSGCARGGSEPLA